jgi:D-glycero-D-manno-heptose 1,7-bisphosphate phosphatase
VLCGLGNGERGAVFLDRDGVINRTRPDYVRRWDQFEFLPGALEALRDLAREHLPVLVVSNQSAVGRGLMSPWDLEEIDARMLEMVTAAGGRIDGAYYCPHAPQEGCVCRKPAPGLLLRAMRRFGVDPGRSCLVGDGVADMLAAQEVGIPSILVLTGRGQEALVDPRLRDCPITYIAADLREGVHWLLHEGRGWLWP